MFSDPGPLRAIVAALIIGYLYGQGGALQYLAIAMLIATLTLPRSGGKPLASEMLDALTNYLSRR